MQIRPSLSLFLLLLLVAVCLGAGALARADAPRPELRGFWADGFNEGYKTPQQIDTLLQRLHDAHCNAIFAQMRKGGDAYYASHYEPWATDDGQHFDALACLIDRAHRMQPPIAVHAWINTCAVGQGLKHPGYHVAQIHPEWLSLNARGSADDGEVRKVDLGDPDAADWTFRLYLDVVRHYDVDGIHFDFVRYGSPRFGYNPVSVERFLKQLPFGYKIKPYTRNGVTQVLPHTEGGDAAVVLPAPDDPAWKQWRRDQVTNFVRKVYAFASRLKPSVVVSAATIAWGNGPHNEAEWQQKSAAMNRVFQDWRGWQQEGILDLACPMTYFAGRRGLEYERTWQAWISGHQYGRASAIAVGNWQLTFPQTLAQMRVARSQNASGRRPYGVMLYSYAGTSTGPKPGKTGLRELELQPEFYAMLGQPSAYAKTPPFAADAPLPSMTWKEHAARGILKGFVRDENMNPVDGALVTLEPQGTGNAQRKRQAAQTPGSTKRYTRRVDGTGFYAFVDLPPDAYTVRVTPQRNDWQKDRTAEPQPVTIQAGQVRAGDFWMQKSPASAPNAIETLPGLNAVAARARAASLPKDNGAGPKVRIDGLTTLIGTDTWPQNLYVRDQAGACLRVMLAAPPPIPFQPGDIISVLGRPSQKGQEPFLDSATACLTDIALLPDVMTTPVPHIGDLPAASLPAPDVARVQGRVTESGAEGFVLDDAGKRIRISLAGRKDFGVESAALLPVPPLPGSLVSVAGYVRANSTDPAQPNDKDKNDKDKQERNQRELLPRTTADIVIVAPPPSPSGTGRFRRTLLLFAALIAFFLALLTLLRVLRVKAANSKSKEETRTSE